MNNIKPYTYLLKFKPTGQVYYGSRIKNVKLKRSPVDDLMIKYTTSSDYINELIQKYGINSFEWEIRKTFDTVEDAVLWEQRVLKRCKVLEKQKIWLNKNIAGKIIATPEVCKKISQANTGKLKTEEHKQKLRESNLGKNKGRIQTAEHRKKNSEKNSGVNNPRYGAIVTEETRKNISKAKKGKPAKNKGIPMTAEQKAKISAAKLANAIYITCEHCGKTCIEKMHKRFHGTQCKSPVLP